MIHSEHVTLYSSWEVNVESATARQTPRLVQLALVGLGLAFAWILLSLLIGGDGARASDDDSGGLLGGVTKTVASTTSTVTDVVGDVGGAVSNVTETVTETAATVVTETTKPVVEAAPAPVQKVVAKTTETVKKVATATVEKVVEPVVEKVAETVADDVVSTVAAPVVELVGAVENAPVVGEIVAPLGLSGAVESLAGTVDSTVGGVVTVVTDTATDVVAGVPPVLPGGSTPGGALPGDLPGGLLPGDLELPAMLGGAANSVSADGALVRASALFAPQFAAAYVRAGGAMNPSVASNSATAPTTSFGLGVGVCPLATSVSGSTSASLGALGLLALIPLAAHRAWARRAGPEGDRIPRAPYYGTDVSPD